MASYSRSKYRPTLDDTIPLMLLIPTTQTVKGVLKKTFPDISDGILFYGTFRAYGGTDIEANGLYSVQDTAHIETWYRPDIKSDCRIGVPATGAVYEILGAPENLNMRNQFLIMKVRCITGGV